MQYFFRKVNLSLTLISTLYLKIYPLNSAFLKLPIEKQIGYETDSENTYICCLYLLAPHGWSKYKLYKHIFPPQLPTHYPHVETVHVIELKSKKYSGLFKCLWMFARGGNHVELK